jgi:hypothetical protein
MATLSVLVSGLETELQRLGYKDSTLVWYRGSWRRLGRFFSARGIEEFSPDLAMAWVDAACGGFFQKEQAGTLKPTEIYLFRVAQMLGDFERHGAVLRRYSRSVSKLSDAEADLIGRFQEWLRAADLSKITVRTYGTLAGEFVAFLGTRGGLSRCDGEAIGAFVATLAGYRVKTVEQKLCAVRSFLRFAATKGLVEAAAVEAVPSVPSSTRARIPYQALPLPRRGVGCQKSRCTPTRRTAAPSSRPTGSGRDRRRCGSFWTPSTQASSRAARASTCPTGRRSRSTTTVIAWPT